MFDLLFRTFHVYSPNKRRNDPVKKRQIPHKKREIGTLEDFLSAHESKLPEYGKPGGLYVLVSDAIEDGFATPSLSHNSNGIWNLLNTKEKLKWLLKDRSKVPNEWAPRSIGIGYHQAKKVVNFLKLKYNQDRNTFFSRYGSKEGLVYLVNDLSQLPSHLGADKIYTLMGNPQIVSQLIEKEEDSDFNRWWNPRVVYLNRNEINKIKEHLIKRYQQNSDAFFRIYGGSNGVVILSKELAESQGRLFNPNKISTLISNGSCLQNILGIKDPRFETDWRTRTTSITLDNIEGLLSYLKEKYTSDAIKFFERYGSQVGSLNLSRDLQREREISIRGDEIHALIGRGELATQLMEVKDERFETLWNPGKIYETTLVEESSRILGEKYRENQQGFFERYGSQEGMYLLGRDLAECGFDPRRINLLELSMSFKSKQKLEGFLEQSINPSEKWNPRQLNLNLQTFDHILQILKNAYETDADAFFRNYGGKLGSYNLAKKLKEKGESVHLTRINTFLRKGDLVSKLTGIKDERFETKWTPRQLQFRLKDLEAITSFLRREYEKSPDQFFLRYGAKEGQINLQRDLRQSKVYDGSITTLMGDKEVLAELVGINQLELDQNWNTRVILGGNISEVVLSYLRDKYTENSNGFFEKYGKRSGVIEIARDLKREKDLFSSLVSISTLVRDGAILAKNLGIQDKRFETDWPLVQMGGSLSDAEQFLSGIRERYFKDSDKFFEKYGGAAGNLKLFLEMGEVGTRLRLTRAILLSPEIISEQLGIKDERFFEEFLSPSSRSSLAPKKVRQGLDYLKKEYDKDSERFFRIYGSRLGEMILSKRLDILYTGQVNETLNPFISKGDRLEEILNLSDGRFETQWEPKLSSNLTTLALKGIKYLAEGMNLPGENQLIDQTIQDYLSFRYRILRGLGQRGGGLNPYRASMGSVSGNKDVVMEFAKLFCPEKSRDVELFIDSSIKEDEKSLNILSTSEIPRYPSTYNIGERGITRKRWNEEEMVAVGRRLGINNSNDWVNLTGAPSINTIIRRFGSWQNFMEKVNIQIGLEEEDLPLEYVPEGIHRSLEISEFEKRAGKLLYSFNPNVRANAEHLLIQLGETDSVYKYLSHGKYSEIARDLLYQSAVRYDLYLPMRLNGRATFLPFRAFLGSHLKWTSLLGNQMASNYSRNISIQSGGGVSKKMSQEAREIDKLS